MKEQKILQPFEPVVFEIDNVPPAIDGQRLRRFFRPLGRAARRFFGPVSNWREGQFVILVALCLGAFYLLKCWADWYYGG